MLNVQINCFRTYSDPESPSMEKSSKQDGERERERETKGHQTYVNGGLRYFCPFFLNQSLLLASKYNRCKLLEIIISFPLRRHPLLLSVAARVAEEMGVNLVEEVGYTIRFEDVTNSVVLYQ
ncbi:hypothetical protein L6452_39411 [Arctium lappa]|uniref:Uncharacterized protein n=1 Tax=Arctium lappa TaxID=4217 RepID=A0ACB8XTC8_ARCLA|nr:hypothetical protein L6452_39411 [Arctium lappa]